MQYKKFVLSITDEGKQEDDLNRFLRGHRVVKVEKIFNAEGGYWAFLVEYLAGEQEQTAPPRQRTNSEPFEAEKELTPAQQARFAIYREVRLEMSREHQTKAFHIFSDRELGELAKAEHLSATVLKSIKGYGDHRMKQYGEEFLGRVQQRETADEVATEEPTTLF